MKKEQIKQLIKQSKGKFFSAYFIKKNNEVRQINCRVGVVKYLKGGDKTTIDYPNLICVYDVKAKGYRNINLDTLLALKIGSKTYQVGSQTKEIFAKS
jgi:hypothetical protein